MCIYIYIYNELIGRSQWPRGLRRVSAAARLLGLWVRIPPGTWMSMLSVVCCQVEVSGTSWSFIQRSPTECGVFECDLKTWRMRRPWPALGRKAMEKWLKTICDIFRYQCTVFREHNCQSKTIIYEVLLPVVNIYIYIYIYICILVNKANLVHSFS